MFWKGAAVSKIVNILAVCEHFLEGSYCFLRLACDRQVCLLYCHLIYFIVIIYGRTLHKAEVLTYYAATTDC